MRRKANAGGTAEDFIRSFVPKSRGRKAVFSFPWPSPLGRVTPKESGEERYAVVLLEDCGEFVLLPDLIRPRRTCVRGGAFPKGEGMTS